MSIVTVSAHCDKNTEVEVRLLNATASGNEIYYLTNGETDRYVVHGNCEITVKEVAVRPQEEL